MDGPRTWNKVLGPVFQKPFTSHRNDLRPIVVNHIEQQPYLSRPTDTMTGLSCDSVELHLRVQMIVDSPFYY
jgi:hypothetical protein